MPLHAMQSSQIEYSTEKRIFDDGAELHEKRTENHTKPVAITSISANNVRKIIRGPNNSLQVAQNNNVTLNIESLVDKIKSALEKKEL